MNRLVASVAGAALALGVAMPVSGFAAAPSTVSQPADVAVPADRIGNRTSTKTPPGDPTISASMQQVLTLGNAERTSRGLAPLALNTDLNEAAAAHAARLAFEGELFHVDPLDGSNTGIRISRTGYSFSTWAENAAAGQTTPAAVVTAWMNSPGHCKNLLNPALTEVGIAYVSGGKTYNHFWVQVFARPSGTPAPAGAYNPAWC